MIRIVKRTIKRCLTLHPILKGKSGKRKMNELEIYKSEECYRLINSVGWEIVDGPIDVSCLIKPEK